jgi:hypothetical protein
MKISASIPSPINMGGVQVKRSASLETPAISVSLKSPISPVLDSFVSDFGSLTGSQRRNPGISTVSRVDMAELIGHSSTETLLYLVQYDPDTYTGKHKDGNLFSDLATSLSSGEEKVNRQFNSSSFLREAAFNNFVEHLPNRFLNTERFGLQFDKSKDLRTDRLDFDRFQDQLQEVFRQSAKERAENLKKEIAKTQEELEYSPGKGQALPVDDKVLSLHSILSDGEKEMLRELEARDIAVRAHEMAHMAAGAGLTSGPSFTFQTGPNGQQYAIGGEVQINTSPGSTPEETMNRAKRILSAASAPTDPSAADIAVAMQATQMIQGAQVEITREKLDKIEDSTPESENSISEKLDPAFPLEESESDLFDGQPQITQEQAPQSSSLLLSEETDADHNLTSGLRDILAAVRSDPTSQLEEKQTSPSLDELLESPQLLENILQKSEVEKNTNTVSLTKTLSVQTSSLSDVSTQTGAISASSIPTKTEQPITSNSREERSLKEITSNAGFSPVETETTQAVKQPALLDLLE